LLEELSQQSGAVFGFAVVTNHQFEVELGALEQEAQSPGIVDIVPDIRVEDDGDAVARLGGVEARHM
jgi:hypothetical protein